MCQVMIKNLFLGLIFTLIIILISFGYLGLKYFPKDALRTLTLLDRKNLFFALLSLFSFHTFDTLRVIVVARALKIRYPFWYGYLVSLVNTFGATVTPAHLGGELLPLYTLSRRGGHFYQILTIVTMKGFSGFFFYLLFFPLTIKALLRDPRQTKEFLLIVSSLLFFSITLFLLYKLLFKRESLFQKNFLPKLKRTIFRYIITCKIFFRTKKKDFFLALILSLGLYFSFLSVGIFLVRAFNPSGDISEIFMDQLPLLYAIFISPTPGGSGVGEFGALPIFSPYLPEESLGLFIILWRILSQYLSAFLGGIIFLIFVILDYKRRHAEGST